MKHTTIIAEAGVNHNGSVDLAKKLIDVAHEAGADAVKFQTFEAAKVISKHAPKAKYQLKSTGGEESQLEMVKKLQLSKEEHHDLHLYCQKLGIQFVSTPFDFESADFLILDLDLPLIKIPSGEVTNAPFLLKIAQSQKPVILSTGMCTLGEIEAALSVLAFGYGKARIKPTTKRFLAAYGTEKGQKMLKEKVSLLHCTTEYPAPYSEINLRSLATLSQAFGLPVGLSDHSQGISVAIAAVALGATIIEKHFTLDHSMQGPDHKASLEPQELCQMITSIRQTELAMGSAKKIPTPSEQKNLPIARKSIVAAQSIAKGEQFTPINITFKRPGNGISPFYYWDLLGTSSSRSYQEDELIKE